MRLAHLFVGLFAFLLALVVGVSLVGALLLAQPASAQLSAGPPSPLQSSGSAPATPVCGYSIAQATATVVAGTTDTGNHCDDCASVINLPFSYQLYDTSFM